MACTLRPLWDPCQRDKPRLPHTCRLRRMVSSPLRLVSPIGLLVDCPQVVFIRAHRNVIEICRPVGELPHVIKSCPDHSGGSVGVLIKPVESEILWADQVLCYCRLQT